MKRYGEYTGTTGQTECCPKCNQNLSHAAYVRHQNPLVCPGKTETIKRKCTDLDQSATAACIRPTISFDNEETQGQECSDIDICSESDAESMELMWKLSEEDVDLNLDGDLSQQGDRENESDQVQVQSGSLETSPVSEQQSSQTVQQFKAIATHIRAIGAGAAAAGPLFGQKQAGVLARRMTQSWSAASCPTVPT